MLEPLLPRLKRDIDARVAELRPLVEEARRLEAAKEALLAEAAAVGRAARRPRASSGFREELRSGAASTPVGSIGVAAPRNGSGKQEAEDRAPGGGNQSTIVALVDERPGVSVAEIASVTKIPAPTVASIVSKLKREGVFAAEAGGVKLASRQPVTLSQIAAPPGDARDDGVSDDEWEAARREPSVA
jgi:hypothetical protein